MNLFLIGISHHTAPLPIRERLAFDHAQRDALLTDLSLAIDESAAIVTCNRTELYGVAERFDTTERALTLLAAHAGLNEDELSPHTLQLVGDAVPRHLFRVSAGLDSIILGEPQILGQVRDAADLARQSGRSGTILGRLFNHAVVAGKRARSETPISQGAGSVSHAAVELAKEILGQLQGRSGVVIGVGEMGQLVARNLAAHGVRDLVICNRTRSHAEKVAQSLGARVVAWQELDQALASADIAITATGAREPILTPTTLQPVVEQRAGRPLLMIDISVPRNIDPETGSLPGFHLHDIDALQGIRSSNLRSRRETIPQVEKIVEEQVAEFRAWYRGRSAAPVIHGLRQQVDMIRQEEVAKALSRLGHLDERDRQVVLALSHGIANKLLHTPVSRLKASNDQDEYARVVADLFGLGQGSKN